MKATSPACAAVFLALAAVPAGAATVTQFISGTVSGRNTVDTSGLFSPAGTNLSGIAYQLRFQYQTNRFNLNGCGSSPSSCAATSKGGSPNGAEELTNLNVPASVLISVEINGINRSFAPFTEGDVAFRNVSASESGLDVLVDQTTGNSSSSAGLFLSYTSPVVFGAELSPGNNPVASDGAALQVCVVPPGGGAPACEALSLGITKATR